MAKLPGQFQRAGVWALRVMIPLDLQGAYQGRSRIVEALQTTESADAKVKGTVRRAEWLAAFEQKRRELNPQRIESVTPELSAVLGPQAGIRRGRAAACSADPTGARDREAQEREQLARATEALW